MHAHMEAAGSTLQMHPSTSLLNGQVHDCPVGTGLHALGVRVEVIAGGTNGFVMPGKEVIGVEMTTVELGSKANIELGVKAEPGPDVEEELLHVNGPGVSWRLTTKSFLAAGLNRGREDFGSFLLATSRIAIKTSVSIKTAKRA